MQQGEVPVNEEFKQKEIPSDWRKKIEPKYIQSWQTRPAYYPPPDNRSSK